MEPILKIRNLSISFTQYEKGTKQRKIETIRNLSLEILPGQVAAVVGESGSGKSLLAHGILGILPYNSQMEGEILYDGRPLDKKRAEELRGAGNRTDSPGRVLAGPAYEGGAAAL